MIWAWGVTFIRSCGMREAMGKPMEGQHDDGNCLSFLSRGVNVQYTIKTIAYLRRVSVQSQGNGVSTDLQ